MENFEYTSLKDCTCVWCKARRDKANPAPFKFDFSGIVEDYEQAAKAFSRVGTPVGSNWYCVVHGLHTNWDMTKSGVVSCIFCKTYVPFDPASGDDGPEEEPEVEPVYTHVLVPNYEFGDPMTDGAELHTAESLLEALEREHANGYRVYKLGALIIDLAYEG